MPTTATLTASHAINRYCSRLLTFSSLPQAALSLLSSASKDASVISSRCGSFLPNVSLSLSKLLYIPLVTSSRAPILRLFSHVMTSPDSFVMFA
ncbi:hypothetical protein [Xenorhabdus bovienii]|uniref:hypothetical protein n=1 Tax=Xenorhabdus bovienii TaxID=40576 RepID=UPI003DA65793